MSFDDADLNNSLNNYGGILSSFWERGGLYVETGLPYVSKTAIRTINIEIDGGNINVFNPRGLTFGIYQYNASGVFIKRYKYKAFSDEILDYVPDSGTKSIRIQLSLSNSSLNVDDADGFLLVESDGYIPKTMQDFKNEISSYTTKNLSDSFFAPSDSTSNGITYTWNADGTCSVSGTATGNSYNRFYYVSRTTLPDGLSPGNWYKVKFKTSDENIMFDVIEYYADSAQSFRMYRFFGDGVLQLHNDAIGLLCRFYVNEGSVVSGVVSDCRILSAPENKDIFPSLTGRLFPNEDANDYTDDGNWFRPVTTSNVLNLPSQNDAFLSVKRTGAGPWPYVSVQRFYDCATNDVSFRCKRNGVWGEWKTVGQGGVQSDNEISILFVGNSLTQDGIAYLPYLLKTYDPDIKFRFYMWYNGGKTLGQQYEYFTGGTPCSAFSVAENSASWTTYSNSKTMSDILQTYQFDVVCMQEYFNYKSSFDVSSLTDWNNCQNYIANNYAGDNGLEFVSLFHAPLRSKAEEVFNLTKTGNSRILQNTVADDMIPTGIAIYRALSTTLDSLGDEGHLSPDGTHAQEGLPCLMQTYVAACWLLDRIGRPASVYGCDLRMTTAIYNTINVPGPNLGTGVITGTDAQNLLAQEVAVKAYKEGKYIVDNNMFTSTT